MRPGGRLGQRRGHARHRFEQSHRIRRVDLVPGVRRFVVIAVQAGKEKQRRHLVRREGSIVAAPVSARLRLLQHQPAGHGGARQNILEGRSSGTSADENLAVAQAPDHVEIDHRHRSGQRFERMRGVPARAQYALFLAAESQEQEPPPPVRLRRQVAGQLENPGRPGSVVVGAWMHRARL